MTCEVVWMESKKNALIQDCLSVDSGRKTCFFPVLEGVRCSRLIYCTYLGINQRRVFCPLHKTNMVSGKRYRDQDDSRHRPYHPRRRSDSRRRRHYEDQYRDRQRYYSPERRDSSRYKKPIYPKKRRKDSVSSVRKDRSRSSSSHSHSGSDASSANDDDTGHFDGQANDKITDRCKSSSSLFPPRIHV